MTDAVQLPPDKIKGDALPKSITTRRWQYYEIARSIAETHGLTLQAILAHDRTPKVVVARHEAFMILYDIWHLTTTQIGVIMQRDHTTVCHGIRRGRERLDALQREMDL